ncbi:MAG: cyclic pyranopterin monophosphate synthase MoaC [Elusimicrobia bacterium]|nr:cyclic pyranopterin monophosphate synthase MoaC [Elusimicrobiota bacterium]
MNSRLTHLDSQGRARMVDVGSKSVTHRRAVAYGEIRMRPELLRLIRKDTTPKGDVLTVAKIAGILAAKRTDEIIPLCHGLNLDCVDLSFSLKPGRLSIRATAVSHGVTGVEMEALTAVAVACLAVYDMVKAADKEMVIGPIYLEEKEGGRSGHFTRRDGR